MRNVHFYWLGRWGWIWNKVEQINAWKDHFHRFQIGPIGILIRHDGELNPYTRNVKN